jgi:hypothetical protein
MKNWPYLMQVEVINPGQIKDKEAFHSLLHNICHDINRKYKKDIFLDLKITGFSEISALLLSIKNIYKIIDLIQASIYPYKPIFAVTLGKLNSYGYRDIGRMDGEVFNLSRELLDGLKKTGLYFNISTDSPHDPCVMWQMNYILKIKMNWSAMKRDIVNRYEKNNNQSKVAHEVGITQQAVSKNIKSSSFNEIELAKKDLKESLKNYPVIKKSKSDDNYSSLNQWLK